MTIDIDVSAEIARRSDVASVAISASVAIYGIADCFEALQKGKKIDADALRKVRDMADQLQNQYDTLVGWTETLRE